jgi:hypothetical protein
MPRTYTEKSRRVRDGAVMASTMSTYEEDEEAEFPGALLQGEHDRLQAGRVPGTSISEEDYTFLLSLEFFFLSSLPLLPQPPRQCLDPIPTI